MRIPRVRKNKMLHLAANGALEQKSRLSSSARRSLIRRLEASLSLGDYPLPELFKFASQSRLNPVRPGA